MVHQTDCRTSSAVDTIAAVSTPPGEGGIGIIRLSGPDAIPLALRHFLRANGQPLAHPRAFHQYYGHIRHPETGDPVDEVLLSVMRAPRSYTREDMAEISGHGGPAPLRAILSLLCSAGARLARAGEFTERAFVNGRLDLTQAEAVLDTIRARTDAGLRAALRHLDGELGRRVRHLRARLVTLLASLEAAIDYAEEDLTFLSPAEIRADLCAVRAEMAALCASYARGQLVREGARTVIIGRPNTGKSSLLNALLGEARAIVTATPGTTRDTIEEQIDLAGVPLRLVDTAGIRHTEDAVERAGVARSRAMLDQADLILLVLDRSMALTADDRALLDIVRGRPVILVLNKADLPALTPAAEITSVLAAPVVELSALSGDGLAQLEQHIAALLDTTVTSESALLANLRQHEAVARAEESLGHALATLDQGGTEEFVAVDIMAAATALGELTGDDVRAEIIQDLFSRFCVGK